MAKIYNSRVLLDPNLLMNLDRVNQQRYANEVARRQSVLDQLNKVFPAIGQTFDSWLEKKERENTVGNSENMNDPMYRAAREEYIRTGSAQPMSSYLLQKEAAEQRKANEAQKKIEAAAAKNLHDRVAVNELMKQRNNLQTAMYDAMDKGNTTIAESYRQQMNGIDNIIKNNYSSFADTVGDSADTIYDARQRELAERAAKKEAEELEKQAAEADAKTLELANKAKEQYSFNTRMNVENNVLPNAKNIDDKTNYKKMVKQLYDNGKLTEDDAKLLLNKIDSIETIGEKTKKATEGATANKAGEKVGKDIDEATRKKELAKKGREALANNRRPTRAQQQAIDEGY